MVGDERNIWDKDERKRERKKKEKQETAQLLSSTNLDVQTTDHSSQSPDFLMTAKTWFKFLMLAKYCNNTKTQHIFLLMQFLP